MGATRRHCGHCKSSNTTMATCAPLGGRSTAFTESPCAEAVTKAAGFRVAFFGTGLLSGGAVAAGALESRTGAGVGGAGSWALGLEGIDVSAVHPTATEQAISNKVRRFFNVGFIAGF